MNTQKADFIRSAVSNAGFIHDGKPQFVFSGKSNVGKSSVINRLLNRKNFARVGNTPGKTVHVNYFLIDNRCYFVDLPGYGYAAVSKDERDRWANLMEQYFAQYQSITCGVMIVDCRHKPTADDVTMAKWFQEVSCPVIIVANKCDKVKKSEIESNLSLIRDTLGFDENVLIIPFSAEKGTGRDQLLSFIENCIDIK